MVKEKPVEATFPKLNWSFQQFPGCCGIGVAFGFKPEEPFYDWTKKGTDKIVKPKLVFNTREEQVQAAYNSVIEQTYYTQLLISLVSNYSYASKTPHQCQELEDLLLNNGWTIYSVFINPNHGNEITLYGKYFPENDRSSEETNDEESSDSDIVYPEDSENYVHSYPDGNTDAPF